MLAVNITATIPALPCTQTRIGHFDRPDQHEGTSVNAMNVAFLRRGCEALSDISILRHGRPAAGSRSFKSSFFSLFWYVTPRIREIRTSLPK